MKSNFSRIAALLGCLGLAAASLSAQAVTTWSYNTLSTNTTQASFTSAGSPTGVATGTVTGYGAVNNTTALGNAINVTEYGSNGLGICGTVTDPSGCAVPSHALDNSTGTESLLVGFGGKSIQLTNLTLGYTQEAIGSVQTTSGVASGNSSYANRGDISVLAYVGSGDPTTALKTLTYATLTSNNWKVIGNYGDVVAGTNIGINSAAVSSSYWLITAYNSIFNVAGGPGCTVESTGGDGCSGSPSAFGIGSDFVKLATVSGNLGGGGGGKVPEPTPMALLGVSLLGFIAMRRRQKSDAS